MAIQPLLDEFERFDIPYLAIGPLLAERNGDESNIDNLLAEGGHLNAEGNRVVAEMLMEYIEKLPVKLGKGE